MAAAIPNGYMPTYKPTTAVPAPISASQVAANATAFKQANWYNGGTTATPSTGDQNLAAAYNTGVDPNKPVIPTPYIQGVLGRAASDTAAQNAAKTPTTVNMPVSGGTAVPSGGNAPPKFDAAGIAASRVAAQRAALAGAVNAYDTSRKSAYDYAQGTTQGNRALLQFDNSNRGDQYGGSAREDLFRLQRSQGIEDTAANTQYQNDIAAENAKLSDFDANAPGMQSDIENQLNQQQFTNNLATNQDTRAQSAQDYSQSPTNPNNVGQVLSNQGQVTTNALNSLKLADYPAESQAAAQQVQQQLTAGNLSNEAATYNLQQLKDPNSPTNQAAKLDLQMKQIDASSYSQESKLKLQQLQKTIADIGVVHTQPQTATEIEMDKVKLQTAQEQLKQLQNPTSKPKVLTPDSYKTDPAFSQDVAHMKATPADASKLDSNPQPFIDAYGYDGYLALRKAAGLD